MRRLIISTLIILLVSIEVHAQAAADSPEQKQAEEWIKRLNALDEWYLSADGKEEGIQPLVDSMMELYAPDVVAEVPPHDKDQIGPVMLRGKENVRKWVDSIARTQVRLNYILKRQTEGPAGEYEGWRLVYSMKLPWGGTSIAFQIIRAWRCSPRQAARHPQPEFKSADSKRRRSTTSASRSAICRAQSLFIKICSVTLS